MRAIRSSSPRRAITRSARARGPATAAELRGADVLLLDDGHCLRAQALDVCSRGRARELEFRATSLPTLVQMVAGGAGVTLLPELAVATETRRADLRSAPSRSRRRTGRSRSSGAAARRSPPP